MGRKDDLLTEAADRGLEHVRKSWTIAKIQEAIDDAAAQESANEGAAEPFEPHGDAQEAPPASPSALPPPTSLTTEQKRLIMLQFPDPEFTDADFELLFYTCARTGLDAAARQIYMVKRDGRAVIQTGIDGYRLIAARTGLMAGSDDPVFEEGPNHPTKCTITVWRIAADGQRYPYTATALWDEYAPSGPGGFMWERMAHTMLAKCTEALALRKAFPAELSGIYTDAEMDQASDRDLSDLRPPKAEPLDLAKYHCPECVKATGEMVPVKDQRLVNAENNRPVWACSKGRKCAAGTKYGWGSWDDSEFDERETGAGPITHGRPVMSGIQKVHPDDPVAACRKWLFVATNGDPNEGKLFWGEMVNRYPEYAELGAEGNTFNWDGAFVLEERANALLDEWEAPYEERY